MRDRLQLFAVSMIFAVLCSIKCLPAVADTFEFEVSKEVAQAKAAKVDLSTLNTALAEKKTPQLISEKAAIWKPTEKSSIVVKTGPDALYIVGSNFNRIYDFKNMKVYNLNSSSKTYIEHSLYADLAQRKAKLKGRLALRDAVGRTIKGKQQKTLFHDFYSEELFSMMLPDRNSGYILDKSKDGATDIYKFNSEIVTSFTPGNVEISGDKLKQFSRFLIYGTHLHPEIREDIEKSGKVPEKLMWYIAHHPRSQERTTYTLKKVTPGDFVLSFPPGYNRTIDSRSPVASVYPRIKELGEMPPADLKQKTIDYYKKAVEAKNYFDALLAVSEYGLQTGDTLKSEIAAIKDQIKNDPDCRKLMTGLQAPETERQATMALSSLDTIDRSRSPKNYLIDVFRANLIIAMHDLGLHDFASKDEDDPSATFVKSLKQNPFIAGVYLDLGHYLDSTFKQPYAWECYDLARKFYPQYPSMKEVNEREQELHDSFPQFFNGDKI